MKRCEFRVGDRVRCINVKGILVNTLLKVGHTYTISELVGGGRGIKLLKDATGCIWYASHFELVVDGIERAIERLEK